MPDCTLVGIVQNITGTGQARTGTRLSVKQSQLPSGLMAHETRRLDFYVTADGTLATAVTDGEPATIEQGAYILFEGPVYAFNLGRNWVQIPEAAEVDINQLAEDAAAAPDPPASVSTSTFNTHIQKLANPDDAGHITNVGAGLSLADGIISLGDLDATFATDAALTAEAAARAAADALLQPTSEKNQANGYVGLDGSGLIADIRIPASIARDSEVTSAIAALSTVYQPLDTDLTTIAGLSPSASDVLQFVGGAWANRTPAQLKTSLSLAQADISGLTTASSPAFAGLTLTGPLLAPDGAVGAPGLSFSGETNTGLYRVGANNFGLAFGGTRKWAMTSSLLGFDSAHSFGWYAPGFAAFDTVLVRDAAATLALRNGASAQTLRVYNSFVDASNYERGSLGWSSNVLVLSADNAGTGSARSITIRTGGSNGTTIADSGVNQGFINRSGFAVGSISQFLFTNTANNATTAADTGLARSAAGVVKVTNGSSGTGFLLLAGVAFASLPAAPVTGMRATVTDSSTATWGATITGGGANVVAAFYNGTNWVVN